MILKDIIDRPAALTALRVMAKSLSEPPAAKMLEWIAARLEKLEEPPGSRPPHLRLVE
jgi:hypothetical protein